MSTAPRLSNVAQHIQIGELLVWLGEKPAFSRNVVSHGIDSFFRSAGLTPSSKLLAAAVRDLTEWEADRLIDAMRKQRAATSAQAGAA
jgi:hypothetical protein